MALSPVCRTLSAEILGPVTGFPSSAAPERLMIAFIPSPLQFESQKNSNWTTGYGKFPKIHSKTSGSQIIYSSSANRFSIALAGEARLSLPLEIVGTADRSEVLLFYRDGLYNPALSVPALYDYQLFIFFYKNQDYSTAVYGFLTSRV